MQDVYQKNKFDIISHSTIITILKLIKEYQKMNLYIIQLLAIFNILTYTSVGFTAYEFGYTAIQFLVVPVVAFSLALLFKK